MNNDMNISERIKKLILGYLQDSNSKRDSQSLKVWLDAEHANREYFNQIRLSWILAGKLSEKTQLNETNLWNKLLLKLNKGQKPYLIDLFYRINLGQILKFAAGWLIILILGSSITYWFTKQSIVHNNQKTIIYSPLGAKNHIILPDGTSVWLNSGSSLEYKGDFNYTRREVTLTGEGYFEVNSNQEKPFIVKTFDISIIALGTSFNVKAYPEEKMVTTTLVEGKVIIEGTDDKNNAFTIAMEPEQKVVYLELLFLQ